MNIKTVVLAAALTAASMNASAGCTLEDLNGYWDFYSSSPYGVDTCSVRISNGKVTAHRFACNGSNGPYSPTISGTLKLDSYCHVSGRIYVDGARVNIIKSTLNQARTTINGIGVIPDYGIEGQFLITKFY